MTRKELYNEIVSLGLQEEVKKQWGDNYTRCPNDFLEKVINSATKAFKTPKNCKCKRVIPIVNTVDYLDAMNCTIAATQGSFDILIGILKKKHILLDSEIDMIYK